ncbi:Zn(II)2Cys6 transcription factor [Aspergillus saccharolyticus JOP 1030-1]|uniref:C6 zinc finger domain protein n=1 Tax=Aspergillus saccharolyticus JOP 1030-1 TaxID=1450539 RepID=A0A318ZQM7_9EURO|nr:C6 zinc finger domain protein [Aspergillus saccharolyticus JOP 1030-1]PYH49911.1 C6 zinc finger domain protein [Aspergillus saccharolyticus JOP 1030-1]
MPRPRRPGAPEPKRRSRKGCWPCKARKVKCGEEKPSCVNCQRQNELCDYRIRLTWGGRTRRKSSVDSPVSHASSPSGTFGSYSLSPANTYQSDYLSSSQSVKATSPESENTAQCPATEELQWDVELAGEMAIETPTAYSRGLHDIHESPMFGQTLYSSNRTNGETSVDMRDLSPREEGTTPWPDLPRNTAAAFSASAPTSFGAITSHPSPVDTNSSINIGSWGPLSFTPVTTFSRPISYLRHTSESHHAASTDNRGPDHGGELTHYYPLTTRRTAHDDHVVQETADLGSQNSPYMEEPRAMSLEGSEQASTQQPRPSDHTESYLTKIMNRQIAPGDDFDTTQLHGTGTDLHNYPDNFSRGMLAGDGVSAERKWQAYLTSVTDNYGLDRGRPDLDLNKNDDHSAIDINYALDLINFQKSTPSVPGFPSANLGADKDTFDCSKYMYYASPVPINIPRYLSPLPPSLVKTPINLMYFHHFLNHTAKMLVPHDCDDNPFISVLPTMAISDSNLLNLTLAYSASHRARYLEHPEPTNRIAHWVSNVFPTLRLALENPHEKVTDNHLAAAIMLLSLKIVSPSTFEVPIPWQSHLKLARDLFLARKEQLAYPGNLVGAFLTRWLSYLDIVGTLSCRHSEPPSFDYGSILSACSSVGEYDEFHIDCFTGFTPRTGQFLTQVGRLTHQCDNERFDELGVFNPNWKPSPAAIMAGEGLLSEIDLLETHAHANGTHFHLGNMDSLAIDRAFRYAGLLHLHRRVLDTSPFSERVKIASEELIKAMVEIRNGASAEVGALFPLFTAGCETMDTHHRAEIQGRFEILERTGMKQIQNARKLMQRCWDEDLPWIALAEGEFLG